MFPCCEVGWGVNNFVLRFSFEFCCPVWASGGAQSAADASFDVYDRYAVLFGDGVHLAPFSACSAPCAFIWVNNCIVVGVGYGVLDSPFVDSSEYAAAAAATVAYVADSFHDVAYRVD